MNLLSHPDRKLHQHVEEVLRTARHLNMWHGQPDDPELDRLVYLHDYGKGTQEFQVYIQNPRAYPPSKIMHKAHTPLGTLIGGLMEEMPQEWLLNVGLCVKGHHSKIPLFEEVRSALKDERQLEILKLQIDGLKSRNDLELSQITHTDPQLIPGMNTNSEDDFYDEVVRPAAQNYSRAFERHLKLFKTDPQKAIERRLRFQYLYSVLLESDRALLILSEDTQEQYFDRDPSQWPEDCIDQLLGRKQRDREGKPTPIDPLRLQAQQDALRSLQEHGAERMYRLTLPTGVGKTLTAARLAQHLRQGKRTPTIIVLPFLSIIDQTAREYQDLLGLLGENSSHLMQSHNLSDRSFEALEDDDETDFFLDTWNSDVIITTFDQVLLALFSDRSKHQIRFHKLCGATLIFDEIQTLPVHLWDLASRALKGLTDTQGTHCIIMSATQPGFVEGAQELVSNPADIYGQLKRYRILFRHHQATELEDFIGMLRARRAEFEQQRTLITLNTRKCARRVFEELREMLEVPCYLLSADITPEDRLHKIHLIKDHQKRKEPCMVVSTQVIEAGVDIDMDHVIRDFAPLDSIIQVAGRCNRNFSLERADVEVYYLTEQGKGFAERIYRTFDMHNLQASSSPDYKLQATRTTIGHLQELAEEDVLPVIDAYYEMLLKESNTGKTLTEKWATFAEHLPIQHLLRGKNTRQMSFIVLQDNREDQGLLEKLEAALQIPGKRDRRRALKKIAQGLAKKTVNLWLTRDFSPYHIANPVGDMHPDAKNQPELHPWWVTLPGQYDSETGLRSTSDFIL